MPHAPGPGRPDRRPGPLLPQPRGPAMNAKSPNPTPQAEPAAAAAPPPPVALVQRGAERVTPAPADAEPEPAPDARVLGIITGPLPDDPAKFPPVPALDSAPADAPSALVPAKAWKEAFRRVPKKVRHKPILGNLAAALGPDATTFASTDL